MSVEKGVEIRIELDYGINYANSIFKESKTREIATAITKIQEARMSVGRFLSYIGSKNPYENLSVQNNVIEASVDLSDKMSDEEISQALTNGEVHNLKYLIGGFKMGLDKLVKIRLTRIPSNISISESMLATRAIDRAIDSLESGICWLMSDVRVKGDADRSKYSFEAKEIISEEENTEQKEEAEKTNDLVEGRIEETTQASDIPDGPPPAPVEGALEDEEIDPSVHQHNPELPNGPGVDTNENPEGV